MNFVLLSKPVKSYLRKVPPLVALCALATVLTACSKGDSADSKQNQSEQNNSVVLVKVNGSPITADELQLAVERTFGDNAALYMSEELEGKLLQSLISSRAISQKALAEMSASDKQWLDLKTEAYREELLVKYYLEEHAQPDPVTNEMVTQYYQSNQDKFGGGKLKEFEYVQVRIPAGSDSAEAVKPLTTLGAEKDWKANLDIVKNVNKDWQVDYRKASMKADQIQPPLDALIATLKPGEIAPLKIEKNIYTLLRLISERELPVKTLSEVSAEIRKTLSPLQLKKAVKTISDKALTDAEVEFMETN